MTQSGNIVSSSVTEKIKLSNTRFNFQFNHEKSELLTSSLFEIINLSKENNIELKFERS